MLTKAALDHLRQDPVMAALITRIKLNRWPKQDNRKLFQHVIEAIVSQQLSDKAATTIINRFISLFDPKGKRFPKVGEILKMPDRKIRASGISWAKVAYIKDFCRATQDGRVELDKLPKLSDEVVIEELTQVKGIGRWTAEMILIFTLRRPDVFSLGDLGLRTAVARLYKVDRDNFKKIEKITLGWRPHRSLASRYLWRSLAAENH